MGLSLPTCCSLKTASYFIGACALILNSLTLLTILSTGIMYAHLQVKDAKQIKILIDILMMEYMEAQRIIFAVILLYGCYNESSYPVLGWLVMEAGMMSTDVIQVLNYVSVMCLRTEDVLSMAVVTAAMFTVYRYYVTLPKLQGRWNI